MTIIHLFCVDTKAISRKHYHYYFLLYVCEPTRKLVIEEKSAII